MCPATAVEGRKLLPVHGMRQQLLVWLLDKVFTFSAFDFWKLGDFGGSWGHPGHSEPYIVPTRQSTYVYAVMYECMKHV
jgi:hypothetical protein